jgi:hypothetical protein
MQTRSQATRLVLQAMAAAAVAFSASAAMAAEGEQWNPPASTKTRAEVKAEMAQTGPVLVSHTEASVFTDLPSGYGRSVAEVRAEARQAAHDHHFNELYVGA